MPQQTDNSPSKSEFRPAWIEKGTVVDVDRKNYTVDVVGEYSSKEWPQLQVMSPYFHTAQGEGMTVMPEVGSLVYVCFPSDHDPPFVIGFVGSFEVETPVTSGLEDRSAQAAVETDELQQPASGVTSGDPKVFNATNASARAGRPFLNPGDIYLSTRDGNFILLRRGGTIQVGATPMCQTVYLPIGNVIRQFCKNYDLATPGGVLEWVVQQQETSPDGDAPAVYRLAVRDVAQDDKATVQVKIGHVDEDVRYQLSVAPQGVETSSGVVVAPKFTLNVTQSGDGSYTMDGDLTYVVGKSRSVDIAEDDSLTVGGTRTFTIGAVEGTVEDSQTVVIKGEDTITCSKKRRVDALTHYFGPPPFSPAVLGDMLITWLSSHTHPAPNVPSTQVGMLPAIISGKFFIPK